MASRVRDLTIDCADDLDRDMSADRRAWLELIDHAPPPIWLTLNCHNPGDEVFARMAQANWLRRVRRLSISGDSQYEVYSGRTEGIRSLFGACAMQKLSHLRLHEACDRATLDALARWPGINRLESLELTDDYHGRLRPLADNPFPRPDRLRTLCGVVLVTEDDVRQFLTQFRLDRLSRLQLSFCSSYDPSTHGYTSHLSSAQMLGVLRSPEVARVRDLTLGFNFMVEQGREVARALGDPSVMPMLKRLRIYSLYDDLRPHVGGLQARLGHRLEA
jgi:hypothetical protein